MRPSNVRRRGRARALTATDRPSAHHCATPPAQQPRVAQRTAGDRGPSGRGIGSSGRTTRPDDCRRAALRRCRDPGPRNPRAGRALRSSGSGSGVRTVGGPGRRRRAGRHRRCGRWNGVPSQASAGGRPGPRTSSWLVTGGLGTDPAGGRCSPVPTPPRRRRVHDGCLRPDGAGAPGTVPRVCVVVGAGAAWVRPAPFQLSSVKPDRGRAPRGRVVGVGRSGGSTREVRRLVGRRPRVVRWGRAGPREPAGLSAAVARPARADRPERAGRDRCPGAPRDRRRGSAGRRGRHQRPIRHPPQSSSSVPPDSASAWCTCVTVIALGRPVVTPAPP